MKIYRGFSSPILSGLHKNPFRISPRRPRNTDEMIHTIADSWFYRRYGIYARSRCLLCSTCIEQAKIYAVPPENIMLISPVSPYTIIYSRRVCDMYSITDACPNPYDAGAINTWLDEMCYESVCDQHHIDDKHFGEIMIDCESFCAHSLPQDALA